jgi:hypothetical protein
MPFTGLCESCRHHSWIVSGRGSRFLRCELSFTDPRFARYPALPVLACPGYERGEAESPKEEGRLDES